MNIRIDKLLILNNYMFFNNVITKKEYDKINSEIEARRAIEEINVDNFNFVPYNSAEPASLVS